MVVALSSFKLPSTSQPAPGLSSKRFRTAESHIDDSSIIWEDGSRDVDGVLTQVKDWMPRTRTSTSFLMKEAMATTRRRRRTPPEDTGVWAKLLRSQANGGCGAEGVMHRKLRR